jgi:hypothetical protein
VVVLVAGLGVALARPAAPPARLPEPAPVRVDFARDVQPLLANLCLDCHGPRKQKGGLRLDSRSHALRDGAVVPGKSSDSPLVHRVAGLAQGRRMPPKGPRLTAKQIALLRAWIDQGAAWPQSAATGTNGADHWAYRPLTRPVPPPVHDAAQVFNPIDRFVQARLEKAGLSPAPLADRRTLVRRLCFDLTGLPPAPEEVEAFVADTHPDAYERLADRLLASPAYGERWARHWLDVVHFAETHGHDQDAPRDNAWPYRDYLVGSFNRDKPYARFVQEQVAGDVLYPEGPDGAVATGLLAAGPWDESSQKDIRDDTVDKKQAQNLDRDDMVTTVLTAFASTTIHCARCHDHKFDPITQEEYYALQAVFAGVDRANRPYDPDRAVHQRRRALASRRNEVRSAPAATLLNKVAERDLAAWEQEQRRQRWHALVPDTVTTAKGSRPTKLDDRSVRFGGPRPDRDVYTVTAATDLTGITAVRLEVLTDDTLPHRGPGRQDNGNLHLNEFRVQARPRGPTLGDWQPVALTTATADFDQAGWTAAMAIDGKPATAWGIYPAVGKPHQVVFTFARPVAFAGGAAFTFTLEQTHGGGHLIGRLRLSVSTAREPARLRPLAPALAAILDTPAAKRSDAQKAELARHLLLEKVEGQWAALPAPQMVYAGAADFQPVGSFRPAKGCRPVFVLGRGDIGKPGARAVPGALSCVSGLPARFDLARPDDEGARRAALARWLSAAGNVLTWRSIVNRVWHHHFGRGLVATPGDLGKMGAVPSHPELIDWLAVEFRDRGGSLKSLHRLIVASAAYRRSTRHDPACAKVDADNLLLWRANRTRLDAESLRDGVLAVTGKLNRTMGGPSVKHFKQSKGIHVTPIVDYGSFDVDSPGSYRRSIYRFVFRTLPDPFLEALDCPDASQFTPVRSSSVTPLQALALLNDRFMVRQAEHFAARLQREAASEQGAQVRRAYLLALGRPPSEREQALVSAYAARHGLAAACRLMLNLNEFVFVE